MATTTQKSGLTFKHKVGYAMGDLGGCMTFALMGAMVTRYYTNVLQVNTASWRRCFLSGTSGTP